MADRGNTLISRLRRIDLVALYALIAPLTLIAMLSIFFTIAETMATGSIHRLDTWMLMAFRDPHNLAAPIGPSWLQISAHDITALGSHTVLVLVTLLTASYCVVIGRFNTMLLLLTSSGGAMVLSSLLKWLFNRSRPDIVPHLVEVSTLSFPSGHAMLSAAVYLSLAAVITQNVSGHYKKIFIICAALLLTGAIGLSRIYLGVHYPSDVIAGWSAGLAWAIICWLLALRFGYRM